MLLNAFRTWRLQDIYLHDRYLIKYLNMASSGLIWSRWMKIYRGVPALDPPKTTFQFYSTAAALDQMHCDKKAIGLVLILPWLNAPKSALRKYENLYARHGLKSIIHQAHFKDFIFPKYGLDRSILVLQHMQKKLLDAEDGQTRVVVHSSSVGCYFYALMLWQMKRHPEKYAFIRNAIAAQVCDSPVIGTLHEMAYGVGKMLSPKSAILSKLCQKLCLFYFGFAKNTIKLYDELLSIFKHDAPSVPSFICCSENDPMRIPEAYEDLCTAWRQRSEVLEKKWMNSQHAQNLRYYPEEYEHIIRILLEKSGIS